jgi:preprotein translocase subunit SecE
MFDRIAEKFISFDTHLAEAIERVMSDYYPSQNVPYLASNIPVFIRVGLYTFFLILPSAICKLIYPDSRKFTIITYIVLGVLTIVVSFIFLGFLQLLYNF